MATYAVMTVVAIPLVPFSNGLRSRDIRKLSQPFCPPALVSTTSRTHFYSPPLCCQQAIQVSESLPSSREDAVSQARASLSSFLEKALRNAGPTTVKQRKLHRQTRLRVEIPLLEESDETRAGLFVDLFSIFSIGKRGTAVSLSVFCNTAIMEELKKRSYEFLESCSCQCCNMAETMELGNSQFVVILSPKLSELTYVVDIAKAADPRPVLLLNPAWSVQEEEESVESYASFLQSFDVVYSYLPLVIQGFFSKTEGAVLKHVKSGAPAGRPWLIFAKEGETMKCVSSLKKRPSPADLENALYNAMAANSPLTKSIKFLRGLGGQS